MLLTAPLWNWNESTTPLPSIHSKAFNRTTLELKYYHRNIDLLVKNPFNRTTLELKFQPNIELIERESVF